MKLTAKKLETTNVWHVCQQNYVSNHLITLKLNQLITYILKSHIIGNEFSTESEYLFHQ